MGAQARKKFLISRAASSGRKPPVAGGMQADLGRWRERPGKAIPVPFFATDYTGNLSNSESSLSTQKGQGNTQLLVLRLQTPPSLFTILLVSGPTAASPMFQRKVMAFTGLRHFNEKAPTPNKYKHRHLQLIMVLLISQISLQIAC